MRSVPWGHDGAGSKRKTAPPISPQKFFEKLSQRLEPQRAVAR
jgi:hypothetical protein